MKNNKFIKFLSTLLVAILIVSIAPVNDAVVTEMKSSANGIIKNIGEAVENIDFTLPEIAPKAEASDTFTCLCSMDYRTNSLTINYNETEDDFVISEDGVLTEYRGTDTEIVVPGGVTQIGTVFSGNKDITSIILPDSLLYLSENAFSGCSSLTEINLPDGLLSIPKNAFKDCSSLVEVTIPDTVLEIETNAFNGCCKIKELVIPDSVVKIKYRAFAHMGGLEKLTVPFVGESRDVETNTLKAIIGYWFDSSEDEDYRFSCRHCSSTFDYVTQGYKSSGYSMRRRTYKPCNFKELTVTGGVLRSYALKDFGLEILRIGENVEVIEEYAADSLWLKELYLPEEAKFTEIPDYAFTNNSITSVTIPENVKRIGQSFICDNATKNKITEINLNEGLEVIDGSFWGSKITSIDLPDSLIKLGDKAFFNCLKLERVEFPENLTEIGFWAFYRSGLKEVVFSDNITYVSRGAFHRCPLKKVVIPESLADIVDETFYECEELEIVVIGGNVTEIGPSAFANCTSLGAVVIPDSVTSISEDAFENSTEQLVIYCNEGSYAQQYAIANEIKYTTLVIDPIENQVYTGEEITPEVNASANNRRLTQDTEYSVSYKDNVNAGSAKAIVKGLGDFKHLAATAKFTILPKGVEAVQVLDSGSVYTPKGVTPEIYVYCDSKLLIEGQDYEVLDNPVLTDAGEYNIAVSLIGNYDGVINATYKISRKSIAKTNIEYGDTVKITYQGVPLEEGKDFIVTKETNENGDVITTVEGLGNYKGTDTHTEKSGNNQTSLNLLERLINAIMQLFEKLFNINM